MWTKPIQLAVGAGLLAVALSAQVAVAAEKPAAPKATAPAARTTPQSPALRPQFEADPCTAYAKALMARAEARGGVSEQEIFRLDQACKAHAAQVAQTPGL